LVHQDEDGIPFDNSFHYRSVIRKLNYLEKSTHAEIAYTVHQGTCYCNNPMQSHAEAIKWNGRDQRINIMPDDDNFECYVDSFHTRYWKQAVDFPDMACS
jgi:hypothetical protein